MSTIDAFAADLSLNLPPHFNVSVDFLTDKLIIRGEGREIAISRIRLENSPLDRIISDIKIDPRPLAEWPLARRLTYYASKFTEMPDGPGAVLWGYICADMDEAAKLLQTPKAT